MIDRLITSLLFLFVSNLSFTQPGDGSYSIVLYDYNNSGFIDIHQSLKTYEVYACSVDYFSNDYLQTSWTPNLKTIKILETLVCKSNTDTLLPFKTFYQGSSYLTTNLLLIVKNQVDTMYIDGAFGHLVSDYYGTQNINIPIIPFKKGLVKLFKLQEQEEYRRLQNLTFRKFWLTYSENLPVYNNSIKRISLLSLNTDKFYHPGDSLILEITGKITSDGSCGDGNIIWILQQKKDDYWISYKDNMIQMDCGFGRNEFNEKQLPLFRIKNKNATLSPSHIKEIELEPGQYRIVVFDDLFLPYFSEIFEY